LFSAALCAAAAACFFVVAFVLEDAFSKEACFFNIALETALLRIHALSSSAGSVGVGVTVGDAGALPPPPLRIIHEAQGHDDDDDEGDDAAVADDVGAGAARERAAAAGAVAATPGHAPGRAARQRRWSAASLALQFGWSVRSAAVTSSLFRDQILRHHVVVISTRLEREERRRYFFVVQRPDP
jgi:hypothetical protein